MLFRSMPSRANATGWNDWVATSRHHQYSPMDTCSSWTKPGTPRGSNPRGLSRQSASAKFPGELWRLLRLPMHPCICERMNSCTGLPPHELLMAQDTTNENGASFQRKVPRFSFRMNHSAGRISRSALRDRQSSYESGEPRFLLAFCH